MENRSTASPMDFEYQNRIGPADAESPFVRLAAQHTRKRQFGIFDSPNKTYPSNNVTNRPHSNLDAFQTSPFPSKPLPSIPMYGNPAFNTPRKFDMAFDSSDIEQTSPENNADSEATPDLGARAQLPNFPSMPLAHNDDGLDKKSKIFSDRIGPLSGRSGVSKQYTHALDKRRIKRRRDSGRRFSFWRRRSDSGSESESDERLSGKKQRKPAESGALVSFFGFINTHPDLPHILSFYVQLLLNVFLVFFFIYLIYSFWSTIRADVDKKSEEAAVDIMAEMAVCLKQYKDNRCEGEGRAPALDSLCDNWQRCMRRDPKALGKARISAHTFAEIFNSFIEPISYKAMIFSILLAFACFGTCNMAFGLYRNRAHPPPPPPTSGPPSTPFSKNQQQHYEPDLSYWSRYQTPHTHHTFGHEPLPSNGPMTSPRKRLEL